MQQLAIAAVAFGDVGAAYATAKDFGTVVVSEITVISTLDADVYLSLNGSTNHYVVPAGMSRVIDPSDVGGFKAGVLSQKRVSGAPTSGTLYIEAVSKD